VLDSHTIHEEKPMITYPEGARALVTGGASGIGAECAKRLSKTGLHVITADLSPDADEHVDVSDAESVAQLRARVGHVDILVNSAGIVGPSTPVTLTQLADWHRTFRVNVDGTFLTCRAFVPSMVDTGWGRIVNLASIAAKDGNPNQSAYSASKAAVIALTKSLGKELATTGVLVNVVAPAAVESPMNTGTDPAILARSQSLTPMGRMGRPDEIAELIAWLSSNALSFSTGAVYDASGGRASY
jgi:NAD(P)-dependent dehydrogenase (short-subunit alcohol dehydrogenase family)